MMEEKTFSIRRRTNVSTSVKGIKTPDYTIETVDLSLEAHMKEFDLLAQEMEKRYPVNVS